MNFEHWDVGGENWCSIDWFFTPLSSQICDMKLSIISSSILDAVIIDEVVLLYICGRCLNSIP